MRLYRDEFHTFLNLIPCTKEALMELLPLHEFDYQMFLQIIEHNRELECHFDDVAVFLIETFRGYRNGDNKVFNWNIFWYLIEHCELSTRQTESITNSCRSLNYDSVEVLKKIDAGFPRTFDLEHCTFLLQRDAPTEVYEWFYRSKYNSPDIVTFAQKLLCEYSIPNIFVCM